MNKPFLDIIILLCIFGAMGSVSMDNIDMAYFFLGSAVVGSLLNLKDFIKSLLPKKKNNPIAKRKWDISTKQLGQRIKKARKGMKLTQENLANKSGIARPNICRIEVGKHFPSLATLERIAIALEIPVNELVK